jgi:transcriptional regulator with XRE-family HTH domain
MTQHDLLNAIADFIYLERKRRGQSQEQFAKTLGIGTQVQITKLENHNMQQFSVAVLSRLLDYAKSIGQSADDVFGMPKPVSLTKASLAQISEELVQRFGVHELRVAFGLRPDLIGLESAGSGGDRSARHCDCDSIACMPLVDHK